MPEIFKDHRVAELIGIHDLSSLTDPDRLLQKAHSLAERLKLNVVNGFVHEFGPREEESKGGLSLVLAIEESHMAIHTWEKDRYAHIDVFTCSPNTNMINFQTELAQEFPSDAVKEQKIHYSR